MLEIKSSVWPVYLQSGCETGVHYRQGQEFVYFPQQTDCGAHLTSYTVDAFPLGVVRPRNNFTSPRLAFICSFVSVTDAKVSRFPRVTVCVMLQSKLAPIVRPLSLIFGNESYSKASIYICRGCTNPGRQVARGQYFMATPNICGSLVLHLSSCHTSGAWNFDVAPRFLDNLCTPDMRSSQVAGPCKV